MKGRISFKPGAVQHIYQNTCCGFLIFYSIKDYLVFFTLFSTVARIHGIKILGLCLMPDHIHVLVMADNRAALSRFVHHYTTWFSQIYNIWYESKGPFFRSTYGFASKVSSKDIRSAIAYLLNNPVEKQLSKRPEEAQWNFLAYGESRHPFSDPLRLREASAPLRRAVREVTITRDADRPLGYSQLSLMAKDLRPGELKQLTDFIISKYNCIDYDTAAGYFGNYSDLVAGVNTAKGSEYDIREDFVSGSDLIYAKMTKFLIEKKLAGSVEEMLRLPPQKRIELLEPLDIYTGAGYRKVSKYLHLEYSPVGR
ncbi:MAG: transposase [Bacteroidales bacterium]|nr:transposase [Bacteroidales bacterium]